MPVNIKINDGNFSFGPDTGFFYTVSKSLDALLKVEADGTVAAGDIAAGAVPWLNEIQFHTITAIRNGKMVGQFMPSKPVGWRRDRAAH